MTLKEETLAIEAQTKRIQAVRINLERQFARNIWGDKPCEVIGYDLGEGIKHQPMVAVRD